MLSVMERIDLLEEVSGLAQNRCFADVIEALEALSESELLSEPEFGHFLAQAYSQTDQQKKADNLLELLDVACPFRGNDRLFRRRLNLQAVARIRRGELEEAEEILTNLQVASEAAGDVTFQATATLNLGVVYDIRCKWDQARAHYRYALTLFQSLGDRASIAGCYHNLAMLFRQCGDLRGAEEYLDRAAEAEKGTGTKEEQISTDIERSLLAVDQSDPERAYAIALRCHRWSLEVRNLRLAAEAQRAVGIASIARSYFDQAAQHFEKALQLASELKNELLIAEVLEELAILCTLRGEERTSREYLREATAAYHRLGSPARAKRAVNRLNDR